MIRKINILKEKASILLNNRINDIFYDYYFEKGDDWLLNNEDKINKDFINNIKKLKFEIILNSNLEERNKLIIDLKNASIEEFSNYIDSIPYSILKNQRLKNEVEKNLSKFTNTQYKITSNEETIEKNLRNLKIKMIFHV